MARKRIPFGMIAAIILAGMYYRKTVRAKQAAAMGASLTVSGAVHSH